MYIIHVGMASDAEAFQVFFSVVRLDSILMVYMDKLLIPRIVNLQSTPLTSPIPCLTICSTELFPVLRVAEDVKAHPINQGD